MGYLEDEPKGIGGWMLLFSFGLFITPLRIAATLFNNFVPIFRDGYWSQLTDSVYQTYHPMWAPVIIYEIGGNVIFIIFSLALIALLVSKSRIFPTSAITYLALNAAFLVGDKYLVGLLPALAGSNDQASARELIKTLATASIWIPYMLISKRVHNTFIEPFPLRLKKETPTHIIEKNT